MRPILFVCAQSSSLDGRMNTVSLFHVIEEISAPVFPTVLRGMSVVAILELDEGEPIDLAVELHVFSGGVQLFASPLQTNFQVQRKARVIADFNGLVIPAPGVLRVVLSSAGHDIATWQIVCHQVAGPQLELHLAPPPEPQPAQQG